MIVSEKAAAALGQVQQMNAAKRALLNGDQNAHVYAQKKWFVDQNGLMKTILSNEGVRITPPPVGKKVTLDQVIHHPLFFQAVPEARSWTAAVRRLPPMIAGSANPRTRHINVATSDARSVSTWLHEAQHAAQKEQNAPLNARGSTPWRAGSVEAYRKNLGETEARLAETRNQPLTEKARVLMQRAANHDVKAPKIKPPPKPTAPSDLPEAEDPHKKPKPRLMRL